MAAGLLTPIPAAAPPADAPTTIPDAGGEAPTSLNDETAYGEPAKSDDDVTRLAGDVPGGSDASGGPLTVGERFGSRYRISGLLGVGGMGAVYKAWDADLGVSVALKVIRAESAGDQAAIQDLERRFKRELLLARQVTHKNVVRIHDLGEISGIKYITMPYIAGQDLSTILKTEGRLPVARALAIARQALSGLVAAHAAGIVHRDLKPANVMVATDGQALLMDFGIARAAGVPIAEIGGRRQRGAARASGETMVGAIVGTIHYMAPEQARGADVDHRADIYAFGLILRDMLVGFVRQMGVSTALAEWQRRLDEPPPSMRSIDPAIPEPLDRLVSRCLVPDPAGRYQTAADLEADLNRLDDDGELIPTKRVVRLPLAIAVVSLFVAVAGGAWWYAGTLGPVPAAKHEPVSVAIADFQNSTNDPAFDRTLEPMLKRALEGAGFISAYDRSGIGRTLGVPPPDKLDEAAAREIAVKQGLGVVLSGAIDRDGSGYRVSVKAAQTVTGKVIAATSGNASRKDQVLGVATKLVTTVRTALGDKTSDSAQIFAMASLSSTSLDVVRHYAAAQEASSNGKFEDARQEALKAVAIDPKFGVGYQLLAVASRNLGQLQAAESYSAEALRYVDTMTERERYTTRGFHNRLTGDYQECVKEYGELIVRYGADVVGHNQRALCLTKLRNMRGAVDEMRQVVALLPNRVIFRENLALYANYASDFQTGEKEARTVQEPDVYALQALAFAQLGQGQLPQAAETYQKLGTLGALGVSFSASGLGDLAALEGRYSDAARILEEGVAADLSAKNPDRAASKLAALANVNLQLQKNAAAIAAADQALANSKDVKIRFLAARVFVEAGASAKAKALSASLASELQAEPQAYAKIVDGEAALKSGNARQAIKTLSEANALLDTWIGHFELGRAYLEADAFTQADSEFDRCIKRKGEALSLFLDEEATFAFFPPVYYYQGRVREGLKTSAFADSYRAYLALRGKSTQDPLLPDVRRRAGR